MKAHLGEFFLDALSSGLVTPLLACTCVGLLLASVPNEGTTASSAGQGLETGPQLGIYSASLVHLWLHGNIVQCMFGNKDFIGQSFIPS